MRPVLVLSSAQHTLASIQFVSRWPRSLANTAWKRHVSKTAVAKLGTPGVDAFRISVYIIAVKKTAQNALIPYQDLRIWARAAVSVELGAMGAVFTGQEDLLLPLTMSTTRFQMSTTSIGGDM
jgi:hypothetical protein